MRNKPFLFLVLWKTLSKRHKHTKRLEIRCDVSTHRIFQNPKPISNFGDLMEKMKAKESRPVVFSNAREDLISKLPDSLRSQMLLYLPTKEAVKSCVLSNGWKSLWLLIPVLDLDTNEFPDYNAFVSFMDRFLDFSREHKSCLHKLKLSIRKDENDQPCVTRWIDTVATPKLRRLDVECLLLKRPCFEVMPLSLYICQTLLYLRLHRVSLASFEYVSLPCVKIMRLEHNVYANEAAMKSLISSCPVLEDLGIVRRFDDNVKVLRVHSQTLTSLSIEGGRYDEDENEFDYENSGIIIDAPRLKYLNFEDDLSVSKIISHSGSLTKVNILGDFFLRDSVGEVDLQKRDIVRNFFTSISGVRDMNISWIVFEFLERTVSLLPQFCGLSCLEAEFYSGSEQYLPTILESCPNLKSLTLGLHICSGPEQTRLSFVPQCLLSSLEFVEMKCHLFDKEHFEMLLELARYFAENSVILKKIVVHWRDIMREENSAVLRDLFALLRQSSTCEIIVR